jgi:uncharacterized protein (TIGR02118 family)
MINKATTHLQDAQDLTFRRQSRRSKGHAMTGKLLAIYGQPTDPAAFEAHYRDQHMPLARKIDTMRTARTNAGPIGAPDGPAPYYRISSYEWDSLNDLLQALGSPEGQAAAGDLANFATGGVTLLFFEEEEL